MTKKFGWCLTNQHEECRIKIRSTLDGNVALCDCGCHEGAELPELGEWVPLSSDSPRTSRKRKTTQVEAY